MSGATAAAYLAPTRIHSLKGSRCYSDVFVLSPRIALTHSWSTSLLCLSSDLAHSILGRLRRDLDIGSSKANSSSDVSDPKAAPVAETEVSPKPDDVED
jgi:hypothetical protein